jgi:hypothetical protein
VNRGIYALFLVAATCATLIAGCGSGSSTTPTTGTTPTSTTTAAKKSTSTAHATQHASTTVPTSALGSAAIATYCETALAAAKTHLSSTELSQFEGYCASLAHDSPSQIKAAEKTLCTQIVKDTVPAADKALGTAECANL